MQKKWRMKYRMVCLASVQTDPDLERVVWADRPVSMQSKPT